ncbi:MAG TPA: hypothetical protein VI298_03785 [Geobacteraceae bacterium]
MKDERDELLDGLFVAARTMRRDTAVVEERFETRLLARIAERRSSWLLWSVWSWRLVPVFAAVAVVVGLGSVFSDPARSTDIFAAFTNGYEEFQAASLLAGG